MPVSQEKVTFVGLAKVQKGLKQLGAVDRELKDMGMDAAKPVVQEAKQLAPKRSGKLAASIRAVPTSRGAAVRAGNPGKLSYGAPIHWGWFYDRNWFIYKNIMPNPFLVKALGYTRQEVFDTYERNLKILIQKYDL